jgi:ABC-type sugar transport system ATPase subunit
MSQPAISFSGVSKRYPDGYQALADINLSIAPGEFVFITGHSGAGKSTLLKLIAAIERASSGTVLVNGQNISTLKAPGIPYLRRNLGLVFQDQKLLYDRSVFDNVMLPLLATGQPHRDAVRRARTRSVCWSANAPFPLPSQAASSSVCASRALWSTARASCWRTNPPPAWMPSTPKPSWTCSAPSTRSASPF